MRLCRFGNMNNIHQNNDSTGWWHMVGKPITPQVCEAGINSAAYQEPKKWQSV